VKRQLPLWLTRAGVFALALSVFVACEDDTTGTDGDLDPVTAADAVDNVVGNFISDNEAVQSVGVFSDAISFALGNANVTTFDLIPTTGWSSIPNLSRVIQNRAATLGTGEELASIPVGALGKTFVYNPDTGQYEIDPERLDADPNGVRFILYAVDPILGQPILPLQEIGYVEIIDTSSFPTINISVEAVISGVTLMDIDATGTFTQTAVTLNFDGTLSDGSNTLGFDFDVTGTETAFTMDFTFTSGGITVNVNFSGNDMDAGTIGFSITDGVNTISFTLIIDEFGDIGAESGVFWNGDPVAIISGNIDGQVTITNADGDPLTLEQLQALEDLFETMAEVMELASGIMEFSLFLLLLGVL
jgi:hypothetical protein